MFIDTHSHLYSEQFDNDIQEVVENALNANVKQVLLPAIDSDTHSKMVELQKKYPHFFKVMIGLHPCNVNENVEKELQTVKDWLTKEAFIAIGEIGLDYYWDKTFAQQQIMAFEAQMQLALDNKLPIVIHTRNAMQDTINMVKPFAKKGLKGVFHCFSDSQEAAEQIIDMGFLLGIGGVLTYHNSKLGVNLKNIDLQHIVLETDAPYLPPVPYRGKRNQSSYIPIIAAKLAEYKEVSIEEIEKVTTANAMRLFSL